MPIDPVRKAAYDQGEQRMQVGAEVVKAMGERLQQLRHAKGLTQPQLAEAVGVPVGTLRNWEQGRVLPQFSAAYQLAKALGVTLDELAGKVFESAKPRGKSSKKE